MKAANRVSIATICLAFAGCAATTSGVSPYGKDTFNLTNTKFSNYPELRKETLEQANAYCISIGKNLSPYSENKSERDGGFAPIYTLDLTFRCLSTADPDYLRPNMEETPDVLIKGR